MIADTGLPIESAIGDIRSVLQHHGFGVVQAEPGAGKTTIVPLRLLDEPWLADRRIIMLEPRRLAARAAAKRMASLLGERVGDTVGVVTRDYTRVGSSTRIEVVTEGILTRRLQNDPSLGDVGLVIFDEFHERNVQGDVGLALTLDAKAALELDLALLIMSATIDGDRVASLLARDDAPTTDVGPSPVVPSPVVYCPGRTFPVDVIARPRGRRDRLEPAVADAIRWALGEYDHGDVLVFLPGIGEIRRTQEQLGSLRGVDVHLLHGSLPMDQQDAAVRPAIPGHRKVVLSTDIAETSLTVDGVRIVVDAGLVRSPQFDPSSGMTRLVTSSHSRASAEQRAGRAGRTEPGIAIQLWSKMEHGTRAAFAPAEMTTIDLSQVVLELKAWGTDPTELRFLDPPPERAQREAVELLQMLGALDVDANITDVGRRMVGLPLHPRLARMVDGGIENGDGWLACLLASLLDERDVLRGRPDELPADLGLRLDLLIDRGRRHPQAAGRSIAAARDRARDLARRAKVSPDSEIDKDQAGATLVLAYPDRIGQRRGSSRGRFRLRNGSGAWVADTDVLAGEPLIVAADLDGKRKDARIRMGAALSGDDVLLAFGDQVRVASSVVWDKGRNDLVHRIVRSLDSLDLGQVTSRPEPGEATTEALLDRVKATKLKMLTWTDRTESLRGRVAFLRRHAGEDWPDFSDKALMSTLDTWLAPFLPGATGRADVEMVAVSVALESQLTPDQQRALKRLTPTHYESPKGRRQLIDYSGEQPTVSIRVQDVYGVTATPTVLDGQMPITFALLSPANRPIQLTADLAGFWSGSWADVRKDMAGRYPKHDWPKDPTA